MPPQELVGQAFIGIHADTSKVPGEIQKGTREAVAAGEKEAAGASKSFGGLAAAAGGLLVIGAVAKTMDGFVNAAAGVNREGRITSQILENTGHAANVTRGHIDALARSISLKTGEDQAQVRAAENVLLTFTAVTNAGKGMNAIFDRTVKAASDIASVMKTDTSGAAKILGKALSDPIKGLTLLRRAGVVLPPTLEAQIKAMGDLTVASGKATTAHGAHAAAAAKHGKVISDTNKLHQAQQILLGAIEGRYKGTAEAAASSGTRLRAQLKDLQITFGQLLLPAIKVVNVTLSHLLDIFNHLPGPVRTVLPALGLFAGALVGAHLVISPLKSTIQTFLPILKLLKFETLAAAGPYILLAAAIGVAVFLIIKNWDTIKRVVLGALNAVKGAILTAVDFVRSHLRLIGEGALVLLAGPFGIAALLIIKNWDTIKNAFSTGLNFIRGVLSSAVGFITGSVALMGRIILGFVLFPARLALLIAQQLAVIVGLVAAVPGQIVGLATRYFAVGGRLVAAIVNGIKGAGHLIATAAGFLRDHLRIIGEGALVLFAGPIGLAAVLIVRYWETIKRAFSTAFSFISNVVSTASTFIRNHLRLIGEAALVLFAGPFGVAALLIVHHWDTIREAFATSLEFIRNIVTTVVSFIIGQFDTLVGGFERVVGFISAVPGRIAGLAGSFFEAGASVISSLVRGLGHLIGEGTDIAKQIVNGIIHFINSQIIDRLNNMLDFHVGPIHINAPDLPHIPTFQFGGIVPGPPGQPQLIIAHGGERVTPPGKNDGTQINFHRDAIVVQFLGAAPSERDAFRTGQAVGDGIAERLATRRAVRTAGRVA